MTLSRSAREVVRKAAEARREGKRVEFGGRWDGDSRTMTVSIDGALFDIATASPRDYQALRDAVRREYFAPEESSARCA